MTYNPTIHHRRSIRLQKYDYLKAGAYFITICTQNRHCLFGDIVNGDMRLNEAGKMIQTVWDEIPLHYPGIDIDVFIVMPNHVHGIIVIVGAGPCACPESGSQRNIGQIYDSEKTQSSKHLGRSGQPQGVAPTSKLSLPDVMHRYKTMTTKHYTDGVKQDHWQQFPG